MAPTHRLAGRPQGLIASMLSLVAVAALFGCSSARRPADTVYLQENEPSETQRFMPLEEGTVYAYDTKSGKGERGLMTIQVRRAKTGEIDLVVGGRTEHLAAQADGIRYASGGYYLKSPLSPENVWEGRFGIVHVAGTGESVTVPAGRFNGCLRTVEQARQLRVEQTITSVYCPHVGLVLLDVGRTGTGHETATLRGFGKRVDPMSGDAPDRDETP